MKYESQSQLMGCQYVCQPQDRQETCHMAVSKTSRNRYYGLSISKVDCDDCKSFINPQNVKMAIRQTKQIELCEVPVCAVKHDDFSIGCISPAILRIHLPICVVSSLVNLGAEPKLRKYGRLDSLVILIFENCLSSQKHRVFERSWWSARGIMGLRRTFA